MSDDLEQGAVIPLDPAASIERVMRRVREAGRVLRSADDERVIAAIAAAALKLSDREHPLGRQVREQVPTRAGLSPENVEATLQGTLAGLSPQSLQRAKTAFDRAHFGRLVRPSGLAAFVLASNVYSAAIRPLAWALLARVPVVLKPSSNDEGLAELFAVALSEQDAELGDAIGLLRFGRHDAEVLRALSGGSDALHAWGSDSSMQAIRASLPATTMFVPHGHGLGAIYVPQSELDLDPIDLARKIAMDVALYDQRGCLSPHFVLVESSGRGAAEALAQSISEVGLGELAARIPRGPLPMDRAAQQLQWRGVGAARGILFEGDGWAVSFENEGSLRVSPGWRNLAVLEVPTRTRALELFAPLGVHLKTLAVAGGLEARIEIANALPSTLAPRVCEVGQMQSPGLLASVDGESPWTGLVRLLDLD